MRGPGRGRRGVSAAVPARAAGALTAPVVAHDPRPSLTTPVLGTVSGAPTAPAVVPSAPAGALGSASSLALTSGGAHSLRTWPGEVACAACGPRLVLTFGAE
ncbi:hypothetical protein ABZS83_32590 [Streptomyces sp. NPDC005426]|uniref:hypothetical protein n=1 Tax=Streptomyces sp. NPDC005426 TaxID=3155344 RepID=UPI0033B6710C